MDTMNKFLAGKQGQSGIVTGAISLVTLIIVAVVLNQVITTQSGNLTGLSGTIAQFLVPLMVLGGLVIAGLLAVRGMRR